MFIYLLFKFGSANLFANGCKFMSLVLQLLKIRKSICVQRQLGFLVSRIKSSSCWYLDDIKMCRKNIHEITRKLILPYQVGWLGSTSLELWWLIAGWSHRKFLSQRQLINRLSLFFHNTWISGYPTSSTSATMGVPRGCGPGLNPPMYFVSHRTYPFQGFISTNLGSSVRYYSNIPGGIDEGLGNTPGSGFPYLSMLPPRSSRTWRLRRDHRLWPRIPSEQACMLPG